MRIFIAGLLGAIAMFVWTSIAHMATPLADAGISKIQNEPAVLSAMQSGIGNQPGLYFFPWVDPKDPKMMQKEALLLKTRPTGILIYRPPGASGDMTPQLIKEFLKELVLSLIATFLLSLTVIASFWKRVGFVTLACAIAPLGADVSYWIWYGFPCSYTLAALTIEVVGGLVAALAIAGWFTFRPKRLMA